MNIAPKLNKLFLIIFINQLFLNPIRAQFTLVGKVSDANGNPIPFAIVWDSIAKSGTKCNSSGFFELKKTNLNNVLRISSVGKPITKVVVKNQDSLFIVMIDDTSKKNKRDIVIKKPVIYLYPEKETEVNLKIEFEGKFNFTYPAYENGWVVNASPNGKLINKKDNKTY
ncbi:MAG: carboxypeptidase-like regulatory domain-containing protein [Chitinophagales bacterium]|nr:carboxypeptidase-like regulatory domain-containing protein [Chitinophagales bacterium]